MPINDRLRYYSRLFTSSEKYFWQALIEMLK